MDGIPGLILFSGAVLAGGWWLARRDFVLAGFYAAFFVYTIFAMVGYELFPVASIALGMYFGPEVYREYYRFVLLSFAAFLGAVAALHGRLVRPGRVAVAFRPSTVGFLAFLAVASVALLWLTAVFARDYDRISYSSDPQFPDFAFSIGFKLMIVLSLVFYAVLRHHARGAFERALVGAGFAYGLGLFLAIAGRSGNRTDVLALALGLATFEAYPLLTDEAGRLRLGALARRRAIGAMLAVAVVGAVSVAAIVRNYATRGSEGRLGELPTFARVLYNDYYTPAHMLFGAVAMDYVRPRDVVRSSVANAFFLGRAVDAPYLQQDLGNLLVPGSSTRSGTFGFYVFAEGFLALGRWGFLYNGVVVFLGLCLWRLLSSTTSRRANAFAAAFAAMFFVNVARNQSVLMLRYLYFYGVPAIALFTLATGLRLPRRAA